MNLLALALGLLVVSLVLVDLIATTIVVSQGSGLLTSTVTSALRRSWGRVARACGSKALLGWLGPVTIFAVIAVWALGLSGGWLLAFSAEPAALQLPAGEPSSLGGRLYHVMTRVFGRGSSELSAQGLWSVLEQAMGLSGVLLVSLTISYLIPIVGAVAQTRSMASTVASLGRSPEQILLNAWNGRDFGRLDLFMVQLTESIGLAAKRHLAYPPLEFFYARCPGESLAVQLATLEVSLLLLEGASKAPFDSAALNALRGSIADLRQHVGVRGEEGGCFPAAPSLRSLSEAGIPVVGEEQWTRAWREEAEVLEEHARALERAGWGFEVVFNPARASG